MSVTAEEISKALNRPVPWEQDIMELCVSKAVEDITRIEDRRIVKEMRMALNKKQADQLREELMRLRTKGLVVDRFIVCEAERLKLLDISLDVQNENHKLKQDNSRLLDDLRNETEMMEFWRRQAFNLQNTLNDLMTRISIGKEV